MDHDYGLLRYFCSITLISVGTPPRGLLCRISEVIHFLLSFIAREFVPQVMTGPGLRVRKHHRAGKGSSGLRVLRYSEDDDSLVWDSHKILGAAQHVLPLSDVEVSPLCWSPCL